MDFSLKRAELSSLWAENTALKDGTTSLNVTSPPLSCAPKLFLQVPVFRVAERGCVRTHRGGEEGWTQQAVKPETFFIRIMHEPREYGALYSTVKVTPRPCRVGNTDGDFYINEAMKKRGTQ